MKKSIILYIDSSQRDTTLVTVSIDGKETILKTVSQINKAQNTLPLIEKLLHDKSLKLEDITEIKVNLGPGSFVGLRVGISIANTLSYLLNIPVNGRKIPATPKYQ